jgi:ABC-type molybdate transport system substrate-binding protein
MKELSNKAGAKIFVDFVLASPGQSILKKYGFAPAN